MFSHCKNVSTHRVTCDWTGGYYEGGTNFDTTEGLNRVTSTFDLFSLWSRDTGSKPSVGSGTEAQM